MSGLLTRGLGAELREVGPLADGWQNEPLDEEPCLAGDQLEAATGGSQARQGWGRLKPIFGLLVLAVVAAALTMLAAPHGQAPHPQEKWKDLGTIEYPSTGCANFNDMLMLELPGTSLDECAAACQNKAGCTGFEYQDSCEPASLCKLWDGNCTHHENDCMAQHIMVWPKPTAATTKYPGTGCSNADDILLLELHSTSLPDCVAACQNESGCTGFAYQRSCEPARLCKLWNGTCTHRENDCMAQHVMVSPEPTAATTEHPSNS